MEKQESSTKSKILNYLETRLGRLKNLYCIVDKEGHKIKFAPNWAQQELIENIHTLNIILKARQLGITTVICLLFLDACLFTSNLSAGLIAHTREDAEQIFKKIKFAYDNLPEWLKKKRVAQSSSTRELTFSNGSSIRVGVSLRSQTFQLLHISEFGKICSKYKDKAEEIISGSLNTITKGQNIFIESTAEGREGYFFDMCQEAQKIISPKELEFKFFFFPWWRHGEYYDSESIKIRTDYQDYFDSLKAKNVQLSDEQKWWYVRKGLIQRESMKKEFPSTAEEAFEEATEGLIYGRQIAEIRRSSHITNVPYDLHSKVYAAWDLGIGDETAIWIFQLIRKELHLIKYIENSGESLAWYIKYLKDLPYHIDLHFVPFDAASRELTTGLTRIESARTLGIEMQTVPNLTIEDGIDQVRMLLNRCWFDQNQCSLGISRLENYKRSWNESRGCWNSRPLHDINSHGSDAFRYLALSLDYLNAQDSSPEELERQYLEAMGLAKPKIFEQHPSQGAFYQSLHGIK